MKPRTWFAFSFTLLLAALAAIPVPALEGAFAPLGATAITEPAILVNSINTPGTATSQFKIKSPGSYYLGSNIAGSGGKYGIEIAVSDVTLDLRGYRMIVYTGQSSAAAIWVSVNGTQNIAIRNGTIDSWKGHGLDLSKASNALVQNMLVSGCNKHGFYLGPDSTVQLCRARGNGQAGFYCTDSATLTQCSASNNTDRGIHAFGACVISECQVLKNGTYGITAFYGSVISRCTARANKIQGIYASSSNVVECTSNENEKDGIYGDASRIRGCTCFANKGSGIQVWSNCMVMDNHCVGNTTAGIRIYSDSVQGGSGNRIENNQVSANAVGLDAFKPCVDNLLINNFSSGTVLANFVDYDENIAAPAIHNSTDLATKPNDALMFVPTYP